jgi:RNA polymerase sigma-70 factor (ECF subfamily)
MFTTPVSLLERIRRSPEGEPWANFVDMYTPLLFTWAHRLGLGEHDIADLVQDVFTILVEHLPQFQYDPQKSFRAWLKTVLLNCWRKQQLKRVGQAVTVNGELGEVAGSDPRLEIEEEEYRCYLVRRALGLMQAEFEPATWKACWEFVVHDRPAAEVGAELGLSVNAVYLAKSRVLRRLRAELRGLLD